MFQTFLILASLASLGEAPTVTNKTFVVENKVPAQPPVKALDYRACLAHVSAGGRAVLAVGVDAPPGAYSTASLEGFAPGLYECFPVAGVPKMQPLVVPKAMEVPTTAPRTVTYCTKTGCYTVTVK